MSDLFHESVSFDVIDSEPAWERFREAYYRQHSLRQIQVASAFGRWRGAVENYSAHANQRVEQQNDAQNRARLTSDTLARELRNMASTFPSAHGTVCDGHRVQVSAGIPGKVDARMLSISLLKLESRLTAMGCPRVNLLVMPDNAAGLRFWQELGYLPMPDVLCTKAMRPAALTPEPLPS